MLLVKVKSCWEQTRMVLRRSPCSLESGVYLRSEQVPITQAKGVRISKLRSLKSNMRFFKCYHATFQLKI